MNVYVYKEEKRLANQRILGKLEKKNKPFNFKELAKLKIKSWT